MPAEGVPSGLQTQDLARCYGWRFPAHAERGEDEGASVQAGACPLSLTSIALNCRPPPLSVRDELCRTNVFALFSALSLRHLCAIDNLIRFHQEQPEGLG
jgi:hypothetical protein